MKEERKSDISFSSFCAFLSPAVTEGGESWTYYLHGERGRALRLRPCAQRLLLARREVGGPTLGALLHEVAA